MFNSVMIYIFLMPVVAMLNLILNQYHFLMALLSLECITLSLVLFIPISLSMISSPNLSLSILILTLGACEASLGLSLMVMMSRSYGTDMLKSLTMNKC
uniref:NADH-ubiquinone oxidoreductase chain 4L n=1 Tax=Drawida japonica TaxID=408826 RepID=A0A0N6YQZ5_9ANNE|nr:NADH dehydrogenase subunit 4L [Drawida japonica]AIR76351.1 NADH dehydrogenase subunit 4L [Drawida japonica]